MASLQAWAQGQATALALSKVFGRMPQVIAHADYVTVSWAPEDRPAVQAKISEMVRAKPGAVRVDLLPVVAPYVTARAVPVALGLVAVGYLLGRL